MELTNTQTLYIYPKTVWRFYTVFGILPWSQKPGRRGQIKPGCWMLSYVFILLIIFNINFTICYFFNNKQISQSHMRLTIVSDVMSQLRSVFFLVTCNVILLSTNIQTWRMKLDEIIHNLRDFDIKYKGESLTTDSKLCSSLFKVVIFLTIIDLRRKGTALHISNVISQICVICLLELFSVIVTNINFRYRKLNEKLMKHSCWKKTFLLKFTDQSFEYFYNEDISMINETRFLHKLLGTTVELTNSFLGPQLFCCFIVCIQEASFLPWFFVFNFRKNFTKLNLLTAVDLITGIPSLFFVFIQIVSVVYNAHSTTMEAEKTSKTVLYILNNQELQHPWEKKLKSLSLQLPLQVSHFMVLELFELKPPLIQNLLSIFSAYCLILVQLHGFS